MFCSALLFREPITTCQLKNVELSASGASRRGRGTAGCELAALPRVSGSGIDVSLPQVLPCDLRVLPRLPAGGPGSAPKGLAGWHPVKRAGASQI